MREATPVEVGSVLSQTAQVLEAKRICPEVQGSFDTACEENSFPQSRGKTEAVAKG